MPLKEIKMALPASRPICIVADDPYSAGHLGGFAHHLSRRLESVTVYAAPEAQEILNELRVGFVPFRPCKEDFPKVMSRCAEASTVITGIGVFSKGIHQRLSEHCDTVRHWVLYPHCKPCDQLEEEERATVLEITKLAHRILFAHVDLAEGDPKGIAIGYNPVFDQAARIVSLKKECHERQRARFFELRKMKDEGQQIAIYFGGNSDAYYDHAFPAFVDMMRESDLPNTIFLVHQHPSAKKHDLDVNRISPDQVFSGSNEAALSLADVVLYHEHRLAPAIYAAKIPIIQVGKEPPDEDVLVTQYLCPSVTNEVRFTSAIQSAHKPTKELIETLRTYYGIHPFWDRQLDRALSDPEKKRKMVTFQ